MDFQSLQFLDVTGKRVLLRADLNVPHQGDRVTDTTRIDRLKPTLDYLHKNGAKTLILAHFGRPDGKVNSELSLSFLTNVLEKSWNMPVRFSPGCIGEEAQALSNSLGNGEVVLLENVRFHKGEEANDLEFAKKLAALGDIYVNDAFSAAHRAHASTEGITAFLPSAAGFLMESELNALTNALEKPQRPVLAVAAGSKISTKLGLLDNLTTKVDYLVLGGGMANTFLHAQGISMGKSLCEKDMSETALNILEKARQNRCEIILPRDVIVVTELKENAAHETVDVNDIGDNQMAVDIGPKTIEYIAEKIKSSNTVVWNGPVGVFEMKPFDQGTNKIAEIVAKETKAQNCISVAGGGDTVAALENAGVPEDFSYISTAGGAFLEWLEGKTLPGVAALLKTHTPPMQKADSA